MDGGTVTITFKGNDKDLEKKVNSVKADLTDSLGSVKNIVAGMGITQLIGKAFNTINASLDGAITRLDTMNNFPKVMKNLGINVEESEKAISILSDKLTGLPTTLDSATIGVQRLVSKNGDLKKSTDIFLAMNNAIIAGGANATIQSSAVEQLTQAYSKGKMDVTEWQTLQMAMPAQLKQVAIAMGLGVEELGEMMRQGDMTQETMDEFVETIIKLNSEGVGGFASFEEQARGSVSGIGTSITNMKTAIVRGTANMLKSLNESLTKANLPTIAEMIQIITQKINEVFKSVSNFLSNIDWQAVIKFIKNMIPFLIKIGAFIKNMIPFLITIGAIIVGWKIGSSIQKMVKGFQEAKLALKLFTMQSENASIAQGLMNGTLKATEGIVALLTGKMTLAELAQAGMAKAQALLNAVMAANPIGLIVAAIAGLVVAFAVLWNTSKDFRNFWIGLGETIKNAFITAVNWVKTKIKECITAFNNFKNGVKNVINSISSFVSGVVNIGKNIVTGIWQGIQNAKSWLMSKVRGFAKSILNGIKGALGIHSPSTEFAIVGKYSVLGYTEALDDMKSNVQNTIDDVFGIDPTMYNNASTHFSPNINMTVVNNMDFDPIGQVVNRVKTYSGGSKNDYNYGQGVN